MLRFSNKYIRIVIVIAMLLVINIAIISLVLSNLIGLEAPEITMKIEISEATEENIIIESTLFISNPNSFSAELKDFKLMITTESGYEIGTTDIPNILLPSDDSINFSSDTNFKLSGEKFHILNSKITGNLQVHLLGIFNKNLPVSIHIITNPTTLIDAVALPQINAKINSYDLTSQGLKITGILDIVNANTIGFKINQTTLSFSDSTGDNYGTLIINTTTIPAKQTISQPFTGIISYEIFNKGTLFMRLSGNTNVIIGGFIKELPFNVTTAIAIPDFQSFLLYDQNFSITLFTDVDFTYKSVNAEIGVIYKNPTEIPFKAYNLTTSIYRIYESGKTLLANDFISEQSYPPKSETILTSNFTLTYLELIPNFSKGPAKWLEVFLYVEFSIGESNQRIPVTIKGLISPSIIGVD
jgi:hypothetical protein